VNSTYQSRFHQLNNRELDLLLQADTHTLEREVKERSTGVGYTFSSPYYYDGLAFMGNETYVKCAEDQRRYGGCTSLNICVLQDTTGHDVMIQHFPSDFIVVTSSYDEMVQMIRVGRCNVLSELRSGLTYLASHEEAKDLGLIVGDKTLSKKPLAIVTRQNDREFSDIINWVMQALFFGEEQGITNNTSLCQDYSATIGLETSDLNFLNAVYCVGSYSDIILSNSVRHRGMNQINNGTNGMIYSIPFGEIQYPNAIANDTCLCDMRDKGSLKCGVLVPRGFNGNLTSSDKLVGMNIDYCRTLAAGLSNGDATSVDILTFFLEEDAYLALKNGTINILAGARVHKKYDFDSSYHFSTPYFYGDEAANENLTIYALATLEDDTLFSSFVNAIVIATIYAAENSIEQDRSTEMPLIYLFGGAFTWALRDALAYSGNYDELYMRNFGDVLEEDRGRNALNEWSDPQIHSIPGLAL